MTIGSALLFIFGTLVFIVGLAAFSEDGGWFAGLILFCISATACNKADAVPFPHDLSETAAEIHRFVPIDFCKSIETPESSSFGCKLRIT